MRRRPRRSEFPVLVADCRLYTPAELQPRPVKPAHSRRGNPKVTRIVGFDVAVHGRGLRSCSLHRKSEVEQTVEAAGSRSGPKQWRTPTSRQPADRCGGRRTTTQAGGGLRFCFFMPAARSTRMVETAPLGLKQRRQRAAFLGRPSVTTPATVRPRPLGRPLVRDTTWTATTENPGKTVRPSALRKAGSWEGAGRESNLGRPRPVKRGRNPAQARRPTGESRIDRPDFRRDLPCRLILGSQVIACRHQSTPQWQAQHSSSTSPRRSRPRRA